MGTTSTFLKTRVSKPTLNKWSSGFTAVKKFAESENVPLIAVWSNGDACGHCINFEKALMDSAFTTWQKSSGCAFWFGCSSDKTTDDKYQGTGFNWTRNSKLTGYPFVRVYWKSGKVDTFESGDYWTGGSAKGASKMVSKLKTLLKNFKPGGSTPVTPTPEPSDGGCDNCNESGGCDNCSDDSCKDDWCADLSQVCENLDALAAKLKTTQTTLADAISALEKLRESCSYKS